MKTPTADADPLSRTFLALSDPTRRDMLLRLRRGVATVSELAAPYDLSLPAITKHLKVLERAGLVVRSRDAKWRPSRLDVGPLQQAAGWLDNYRDLWEAQFDRPEAYLKTKETDDEPFESHDQSRV